MHQKLIFVPHLTLSLSKDLVEVAGMEVDMEVNEVLLKRNL